jgi:hypothetical protein
MLQPIYQPSVPRNPIGPETIQSQGLLALNAEHSDCKFMLVRNNFTWSSLGNAESLEDLKSSQKFDSCRKNFEENASPMQKANMGVIRRPFQRFRCLEAK